MSVSLGLTDLLASYLMKSFAFIGNNLRHRLNCRFETHECLYYSHTGKWLPAMRIVRPGPSRVMTDCMENHDNVTEFRKVKEVFSTFRILLVEAGKAEARYLFDLAIAIH